jgi:HSP20 family protein
MEDQMAVKVTKKRSSEKGKKAPEQSLPAERVTAHPVSSLRHEVDRLFDDFMSGWPFSPGRDPFDWSPFRRMERVLPTRQLLSPRVDVSETDKAFGITAELPGMKEDDIEVVLSDGVLTLKGTKSETREEKDKDYHLSERVFGEFRRSFRVPDTVDDTKVKATFKNGVLEVSLPKTKSVPKAERKIQISAS